jgi:hypothetical protein
MLRINEGVNPFFPHICERHNGNKLVSLIARYETSLLLKLPATDESVI